MIPFNQPSMVGNELEYLSQVLNSSRWCGDGAFTKKVDEFIQSEMGAKKALMTTSCTDALEMTALLMGIEPGDEVIVPSFTFVSTANAYALYGAKPVFVDIRTDTMNIDESLIEAKITPRTKAIALVHYAGVGCDMDKIMAIANKHGLDVIEDNAHGFLGSWRGKKLGTFGRASTLSFHETKNFVCGEGGALVLTREDDIERAEILREKGTNRRRFLRGQVDKYTWVDLGSSFLPAELNAAVLYAQLEKRQQIEKTRFHIWKRYDQELAAWAKKSGIQRQLIPDGAEHTAHMYYLVLPDLETRTRFISYLKEKGITAPFHYQSLHLSDMGMKFGGKQGDCPVTEKMSDCLMRLPLWNKMTDGQVDEVIDAVTKFSVAQL